MDTLLILLGVIGFGAVMVAVHVFVEGSQPLVYEDEFERDDEDVSAGLLERRSSDRRSGDVVVFPLVINDLEIPEDRRVLSDRRCATS